MSAQTTNIALIQDEDVLRKMWADTEDFGKKKEIRSHMYKLREQRLKEFYNSGEVSESKTTKTSKVSKSSTHADSLIDQSFNSLKSKEVRDSESPTREIHYKLPDNNEWQTSSNKEISKDGKTQICQTLAAVQGSQKIEGGQVDFKARSEQTSSVYEDANTKAVSNKFQTSESAASHSVSTKQIPTEQIELPTNLQGTKITRKTKTLPDGSIVTTTRYNTESGASQTCVQSAQVKTSQSSLSSRTVNQSQSTSESGNFQDVTKVKILPEQSLVSSSRYENVTGSNLNTTQTSQQKTAQTSSSNRKVSEKDTTYISSDLPDNIQGVTKVTRETKTLPDGTIVRTTRYDTTGAASHSEIKSNVKVSRDHTSAVSSSSRHNEQEIINEYGTLRDNQQNYKQQNRIDQNIMKDHSTENKSSVISTDERTMHNVDQSTSKVTKEHHTKENIINKTFVEETDGNKMSQIISTSEKQPVVNYESIKNVTNINRHNDYVTGKICADNFDSNQKSTTRTLETTEFPSQKKTSSKDTCKTTKDEIVTNITTHKGTTSEKIRTDNFVNTERQQEQITRDKKIEDVTSSRPSDKPTSTEPRGRSPTRVPKSEYQPSKPAAGQYDTTYKTDYTSKKISVEVSPTHDAFARSLRSVTPERIHSRDSHRTSNSSLPEKMRHSSRYSPERHPKDRSISPTKSDRYSSTDTYIHGKNRYDQRRSPSPKRSTNTFGRTTSNETITISTTAKFDVTNKKAVTRKSNTDIITKSRSPSPTKFKDYSRRSGDIITDLDDDVTITTTTITEKTTTGSRPTSLELTKKSKKITDRSPSSPLADAVSPKKSPTKEVRRSSSCRSPTKDSPNEPRRSSLKSPTKESPSKCLPEDRPLKRTDTYEERCRQILGITEVSDKRKSSLERSLSKRGSFKRNISSSNVDTTVKTSETIKSPTKTDKEPLRSPAKVTDIKKITTTDESLTVSDKRKPSSRPTSKDFSSDITLETVITQKTTSEDKPNKKSPITEFPSQRRSPSRESQKTVLQTDEIRSKTTSQESKITDDRITTKRPSVTTYPDSPTRAKSPSKEGLKTTTGLNKLTTTEFISQEKISTSDNFRKYQETPNANFGPTDDKPSTKRPGITEFPSQKRTPSQETLKTTKDKTVSIEDIVTEEIHSTKNVTEKYISTPTLSKSGPTGITKGPSQKRTPSKENLKISKNKTVSIEDLVTQEVNTSTRSKITEFPSQTTSSSRETLKSKNDKTESINDTTEEYDTTKKLSKPSPTKNQPGITEFPSQKRSPSKEIIKTKTDKTVSVEDKVTSESIIRTQDTTDFSKSTDMPKKKGPSITEFPSQIRYSKDKSQTSSDQKQETTKSISKQKINKIDLVSSTEDITNEFEIIAVTKTTSVPKDTKLLNKPLSEFPSQSTSSNKTDTVNIDKEVTITDTEVVLVSKPKEQPKQKKPSITEFPSQTKSPKKEKQQPAKDTTKVTTNKFITKEKLATDEITSNTEEISSKYDMNKITKDTKYVREGKVPTNKTPISEYPSQTKVTSRNTSNTEKVDTEDITDIIEDLIITDINGDIPEITSAKPKKRGPTISEFPSQTRPKQNINDTTDFLKEVVVTDEFEINISKLDKKPKGTTPIAEFPLQIRKEPINKQTVNKNIPQKKIIPKENPKITEFPSQIRKDKKPTNKEPTLTAKHVEPISYEGRVPVEEPLCVKKHINTDCPDDEHNKHHIVKKVLPGTAQKKLQKQFSVDKPDKKAETPLGKKPLNGITEYRHQYSNPKSTPSPKTKPSKPEEPEKVFKPSNKINTSPSKPSTKPVNGIGTTKVFMTSVKQTDQPISETIIRKTCKSTLLKENESPEKPKKIPTRVTPTRGPAPTTRPKPSQPDQAVKKHLVTTTITLKNSHQPKISKTKEHLPKSAKITNYEKKITDIKQRKNLNEISTETDEESVVEEMTENVDLTKKNVTKLNKKLDKKCITTKTVIINNNTQPREIIVDLQRSTSSREPTPDIVCPVPFSRKNGESELPRYPDEIVEPDDDSIKRKPKRLSDIPLIEYEDTTNFSRITEIVDSHVITERDKVDHTDESLLSVNRKINLFSDTADKLTKDTKKPSVPAPKVERPKFNVTKDLESDECLLSVSEKVNKFVNTAEQFMNVHELPERPKSPRCKYNDGKTASTTFISKEQKTTETQNTRKISLENLDIDTKKITERKPSRTASPDSASPQRRSPSPKTENYPNYNTITKRVSLEILDSNTPTKPQERPRAKTPDRKSPTRTDFTSKHESTFKEFKGTDISTSVRRTSESKSPRNVTPEPSKQTTPNRRPSNEYSSIKDLKTQDHLARRDCYPEPSTPKTSRKKPIEDKRTILSSTGRLRSTESIKKARALFENISKEQAIVRPSSKTPEHYMLPLDRSSRPHSPHVDKLATPRTHSPNVHPGKGDVPHYMLPLDRRPHSPDGENLATTHDDSHNISDVYYEGEIPHYMLPLDRRPHSPHGEDVDNSSPDIPDVHYEKGDIPHYMLPLDRRPHSPQREDIDHSSPDIHYEKGDTPHYMLPIDRSVPHSPHRENSEHSLHIHHEKGETPHYMLPLDRSTQPSPHRENIDHSSDIHYEKGDTPHYMLPLDRSMPHSPHRENSEHSLLIHHEQGETPHYMLPLDRSTQDSSYREDIDHSSHDIHYEKGTTPHYMLPLDRSVPHSPHRENSEHSLNIHHEKGETPHYMLPLDRSTQSSPHRENIGHSSSDIHYEKGDTPHYMLPLDRSVPHSPHRENSEHSLNIHHEKGETPHYMLPLDRSTQDSPHREDIEHSSPDVHYETGDAPHYMLPLDRSTPHSSHKENLTTTENESRTTKFGVTLRKTPTSTSPTTSSPGSIITKTSIERRFENIETLTEEEIQEIFEIEILEELLQKVTSYEIRRIIRTQIRLVKKLISENRLTTYIQERKCSKTNKEHSESTSQKSKYQSTYSYNERRTSSDTTIKDVRKQSPVRERSPQRTSSPLRKPTDDETTIRSTYTVRKTSIPKETFEKTEAIKRISQEGSKTDRTTTERTATYKKVTETRKQSPPRPSSPIRKLHPDETIIRSTYTVRKSSIDKTPEVVTKKTEEIRKSSPERTSKTKTDQIRKTSTDKTTYTTTERSTQQSQSTSTRQTKVSSEKSPTRKSEPRKPSPDRKPDSKTTYSVLKKTEIGKKKVEESKPEWVTQRNLKKVSPSSVSNKVRTTSSKTSVKQEKIVSSSSCQPTDLITSSYGVGPTDENGTPLFGLKALRTQHNNNNTTKVQGTVIQSQYYSENGQEPVGQISVTKYSTDPTDLSTNEQIENNNFITSVTTTQKFGYEDTPSLDALTSSRMNAQIEDSVVTSDRTSTFKRKNSVKEISQKFIDSTVDTLKNERQTSYPKAGLILRTSSFKDSKGASNEEDTSTGTITSTKTTKKTTTTKSTSGGTTKTKSTSGGTFLSNKSTISGVQDVISRMKTEEYQEADYELAIHKAISAQWPTTKIIGCRFHLGQAWYRKIQSLGLAKEYQDEKSATGKWMRESAEDAEARNLLNKFIGSQVLLSGMENRDTSSTSSKRTVKCTEVVPTSNTSTRKTIKITKTITEGGKTTTKNLVFQSPITEEELENIWDEQTLRLLLEQSTAYEERRIIRSRLKKIMAEQEACAELVEKASQEQTTGKIEGESLLLPLLQGLLQAPEKDQTADSGTESGEDQRNGLIAEVQIALDKLSQSLFNDSTDISEERRSSLLCLVTKLQAGLSTAVPKVERRLSSDTGRFSKRKNRKNRHTVGVSSEELADARRLMEEISGHKITTSTTQTDSINIQKRNSESNVSSNTAILSKKESDEPNHLSKQNSDSSVTSNPSINKYINKSSVKNTTPKPFSSSNNSSTVQTPDLSEHLDAFFEDEIQKMSSQDKHLDELVNKSHQSSGILKTEINGLEPEDNTIKITELVEEPKLSVNPIYSKPENSFNQFDSKHMDRFNTQIKKQRMKRANTIDIPKPLQFYEDSDCSDGETEEQKHKNNYYALRGPIRVGDPVNKRTVPTFQPKTASDQKFLAFLNKNADSSDDKNKNSIWTDHKNRAPVWGSKFGNIKNNFENSGRPQSNNVKNFWKTQDDALTSRSNQYGPKISRQSARNLQQMFEDKQREKDILPERLKPLNDITEEHNALTGKLTIKTEPEKNYRFLPGPLPVNQFSHAPQSAFKPIPKRSHTFQPIIQEPRKENVVLPESPQELLKTEIKDNNKSLFLYSPKPLTNSQGTSPALSPVSTKPWLTPSPDGGSRVLNMAAKKFEVPQQQNETHVIKPRKLSKEITSAFVPKQQTTEKLVPSYITKTSEVKNSTVRKLSDQYDTIGSKTPEYTSHTSVVYQPTTPLKIPEVYSEKVSTNDNSRPKFTPTSPREPKPTPWWHQAYIDKVGGQRPIYNQQKSFDNEKKIKQFQSPSSSYNSNTALYSTKAIHQPVPEKESNPTSPENVYTSTLTFNPAGKPKNQQLEAVSHPPKLETQLSNESIHEYTAISSKVMGGAQQAVTVKQGPMNRNEHDMAAVFNLKNTLSNLGKTADDKIQPKTNSVSPIKPSAPKEVTQKTSVPDPIRKFSSQNTVSAQGGYYKAPEPQKNDNISQRNLQRSPQRLSSRSFGSKDIKPNSNDPKLGVVKPMPKTMAPVYNNVARIQTAAAQSQQTVEFNEKGQGVITSKFHIPVVSVEPGSPLPSSPGGRALSKSDSWHQICLASNQTANKPTPGRNVVKSKSSHSLAVPQRQFEAGMSKDELLQKRKAMESYLLGGNKSPQTVSPVKSEKVVKTSINRIKTSEKQSAYKSSGIVRSRTLPDIVCPPLLDENNVDQAFEDLFKSSCI